MTETHPPPAATAQPTPRIAVLDRHAGRLEPEALPVVPPPAGGGPGSAGLVLGGAAVLALGLAALQTGNFIADQFARAPLLGWLTLAVAVLGFGLIGAAGWRELRGLFGLRSIDRLRRDLADPQRAAAAARGWLADIGDAAGLAGAVTAAGDAAAIAALLRAGPVAALRRQAEALGRDAALQVVVATAAIPSPMLDGLLVAWRGVRLVRQVAMLHGMRPGLFATLALLRRTAFSAAAVAAADMAADAITRAVLSSPLAHHVAGEMAGAGVAARRMIVLARATAAACSPLPPG